MKKKYGMPSLAGLLIVSAGVVWALPTKIQDGECAHHACTNAATAAVAGSSWMVNWLSANPSYQAGDYWNRMTGIYMVSPGMCDWVKWKVNDTMTGTPPTLSSSGSPVAVELQRTTGETCADLGVID